jgi:hypothetical protein
LKHFQNKGVEALVADFFIGRQLSQNRSDRRCEVEKSRRGCADGRKKRL